MSKPRDSMPESSTWRTRYLVPLGVFVWPFVFLFPYVVPIKGRVLAVDNDFYALYFSYKAYLLDTLSHGRLPWWSPSESAGFPFYASPFTQAFYPLNLLLVAFYKLAGGYEPIDHQRYAILGLSIFGLGLFFWLRALRLNTRAAIYGAVVFSVSFKVTEILRFPNAIHTAAWYPWGLLCLTAIASSTTMRAYLWKGVALVVVLVCLLTGGYPYYVYYSAWLFGPYAAIAFVPALSAAVLGRRPARPCHAAATVAIAGVLTFALCGSYLYKTSLLMQQTTDRSGQNFVYSTEHVFNATDTIGSWIFPPASQLEGWYYFGMINVFLVVLYVVGGRASRAGGRWLNVVLVLWIATITYITYGKDSYLFIVLWKYMPAFSQLRVWGRMNILLVPLLAWFVAAAYEYFESLIATEEAAGPRATSNRRPLSVLGMAALLVLSAQGYMWLHGIHDSYWTNHYVRGTIGGGRLAAAVKYLGLLGIETETTPQTLIARAEAAPLICAVLAAGALAALLMVRASRPRAASLTKGATLAGLIGLSAIDLAIIGPWVWAQDISPVASRRQYSIDRLDAESLEVPRAWGETVMLASTFNVGVLSNWYFKRYVAFLDRARGEPEAADRLLGVRDGRRLFVTSAIDPPTIHAFLDDAARRAELPRVEGYTGDELTVSVRMVADGYLTFIDNWDPDWRAYVDDHPVPIDLLFGTFKAVRIPAGQHRLTFVYRPTMWPVRWGALIQR